MNQNPPAATVRIAVAVRVEADFRRNEFAAMRAIGRLLAEAA